MKNMSNGIIIANEYGTPLDISVFGETPEFNNSVSDIYWDHKKLLLKDNLKGLRRYKNAKEIIITKEVFDVLRQVDSKYFARLFDAYWRVPASIPNARPIVISATNVELYTEEYFETIKENILDTDPDYFLESIYGIQQLLTELSEEQIRVSDLCAKNVVHTPNGIVVIDPDCYRIMKDVDKKNIFNQNMASLDQLILGILRSSQLSYTDQNKVKVLDSIRESIEFEQRVSRAMEESNPYGVLEKTLRKTPQKKTLLNSLMK